MRSCEKFCFRTFLALGWISNSVTGISQLAGNYIVGPGVADYPTPIDAFNALEAGGTSDTVNIFIKDGIYEANYYGLEIESDFPVTIGSLSESASAVELKSNFSSIYFQSSSNVNLKNLTIVSEDLGGCALQMRGEYFTIDSCVFIASPLSTAKILVIEDDEKFVLSNSTFNCNLAEIDAGEESVIEHNVFNSRAGFYGQISSVRQNEFNAQAFASLLFGTTFSENQFASEANFSGGNNLTIEQNIFEGECSLSHSDNSKVRNNFFYNFFWILSTSASLTSNNIFYSNVYLRLS